MPLVSIITPAYNSAGTLAETIESVRVQSFTDWEMIIVDDCSSDGTTALATHYAHLDERIRIIRRAEQGGVSVARNQGLSASTGRYIAFIDADDLWLKQKLELQLAFMAEHQATISCTAYRRFITMDEPKRVIKAPGLRITFDTLLRKNTINLLAVMIDRDKSGPFQFDETLITHEDLALWLEMTKSGHDIYFFDRDLARLRLIPVASHPVKMLSSVWRLWKIFRHKAGLPVFDALLSIISHSIHSLIKRF